MPLTFVLLARPVDTPEQREDEAPAHGFVKAALLADVMHFQE